MPGSINEEAIICFESVSKAIMAEQMLAENGFLVRVMPVPAGIREGCGFCLRFSPADLERAAAFLSGHGFPDARAYLREETAGQTTYRKIPLTNGGDDATGS